MDLKGKVLTGGISIEAFAWKFNGHLIFFVYKRPPQRIPKSQYIQSSKNRKTSRLHRPQNPIKISLEKRLGNHNQINC